MTKITTEYFDKHTGELMLERLYDQMNGLLDEEATVQFQMDDIQKKKMELQEEINRVRWDYDL